MKKTALPFLLLFSLSLFSQSSKTILNDFGVSIIYSYQNIGSIENPETGTNFTKYKIKLKAINSSGKFFEVNATVRYDEMKVGSEIKSKEDHNFNRDKAISWKSSLDLRYYKGPAFCNNRYKSDETRARWLVMCPNSTAELEGEFVYPTDFGSNPPIEYFDVNIVEVKTLNDSAPNKQYVSASKQVINNTSQRVISSNSTVKITAKYTKKMKIVFDEIENILSEACNPFQVTKTGIDYYGNKTEYFERSPCRVNFVLNGCNGEISGISTYGDNIKVNNAIKDKLNQLQNKYKIIDVNDCYSLPAEMDVN